METSIYYFTGTGNSLAIAKKINQQLKGSLIAIAHEIENESIEITGDRIIIVFPMYHHNIPLIVKRFINKIESLEGKYVAAICTYGHNPGICLEHLQQVIAMNQGKLSLGFAIQMPYNYISPQNRLVKIFDSFALEVITNKEQQQIFARAYRRVDEISQKILEYNEGIIETKSAGIELLVDRLKLRDTLQKNAWLKVAGYTHKNKNTMTFKKSIQLMDHGFYTTNQCNGCSICEKICPVDNISMQAYKPLWHHQCEQCFACLQWCPTQAIQFTENTIGQKRYTHPEITLGEMINGAIKE